jgi:hypothetical protein
MTSVPGLRATPASRDYGHELDQRIRDGVEKKEDSSGVVAATEQHSAANIGHEAPLLPKEPGEPPITWALFITEWLHVVNNFLCIHKF